MDIGAGGRRTTRALCDISSDYLGVENSAAMITACRQRFPHERFEAMAARLMAPVQNDSVFLAVFSCNGIGMVSPEDRLLIVREVFRVFKPGGVVLFSTHNQYSSGHRVAFQWPEFKPSTNPARLLVRMIRFRRQMPLRWLRRRQLRVLEVRTPKY